MRSASISTRPRPRCFRACPGSALRSPAQISFNRDQKGAFNCRRDILGVAPSRCPRVLSFAPDSCGFRNGSEPLDASAVHPEAYGLARKIVAACSRDVRSLMGDVATLKSLDPSNLSTSASACRPYAISCSSSKSPGRDPRPQFKTATFAEGIHDVKDLKPA